MCSVILPRIITLSSASCLAGHSVLFRENGKPRASMSKKVLRRHVNLCASAGLVAVARANIERIKGLKRPVSIVFSKDFGYNIYVLFPLWSALVGDSSHD